MLNPLTLTFNDNRELEARFRRDQADGLRLYDLRAAALHFFTLMVAVWRDIWLCASSPSWEELRRRMTTETRLFGTERTHAFSLLVVSMIVLLVCNPKLRMSRRRNLYLTITRCLNASTCLLPITPASITPSGLTGGIMWLLGHTTLFPFSTPLPFREHLIISLLVLLVGMPFARGAYAPLGLCTGWKHYADQDATCNALFSWSQIARAPVLWFVLLLRDGMHSAPVWMHKDVEDDVHVCYMAVMFVQLLCFVLCTLVLYYREYDARVRWLEQIGCSSDSQHARQTMGSSVATVALLLICMASHVILCTV